MIVGGVGAIALAAGFIAVARTAAPPSDLEAAVAAAQARRAGENRDREAAWGETREGSAFVHYAAAMRSAPAYATWWWDTSKRAAFHSNQTPSAAELSAQRSAWATALEEITAGAHCRDASWQPLRGNTSPMSIRLAGLVEVGSRTNEARWREAVRLWLDLCTFILDCDDGDGLRLDLWTDAAVQELPDAVADELAAGLLRLEPRLQTPPDPAAVMATQVRPLLDGEYTIVDWYWKDVLAAWQWGFDPGQRHLEAFAERFAALEHMEPVTTTGIARDAQWQAMLAKPVTISSNIAEFAAVRARGREQSARFQLLQLRMLRIALAARHGAAPPRLLDPWSGEPLAIDALDDAVVVRSSQPKVTAKRWTVRR